MNKVATENHQYGLNLEADERALYGDQVEYASEIRQCLWDRLNKSHNNFKELGGVVQNPQPVTVEQFKEWQSRKEEICVSYIMSKECEDLINDLENFVIAFHVR